MVLRVLVVWCVVLAGSPAFTQTAVPVGIFPAGAAVHPDSSRVYVTNNSSATVSVIATATNAVVATVPVGLGPTGVAVSPDGAHLYVANAGSATVSVIATAVAFGQFSGMLP